MTTNSLRYVKEGRHRISVHKILSQSILSIDSYKYTAQQQTSTNSSSNNQSIIVNLLISALKTNWTRMEESNALGQHKKRLRIMPAPGTSQELTPHSRGSCSLGLLAKAATHMQRVLADWRMLTSHLLGASECGLIWGLCGYNNLRSYRLWQGPRTNHELLAYDNEDGQLGHSTASQRRSSSTSCFWE